MSISSVPKYRFEAAHSLMLADYTDIIAARYIFREFLTTGVGKEALDLLLG